MANRAPIAKLTLVTPLPIRVGQPVQVDASGSTDPDGPVTKLKSIVKFAEGKVQEVTGKPGIFTLNEGFDETGIHDITLEVIDHKDDKATDKVTVDVLPPEEVPVPVDCVPGEKRYVGEPVPAEACRPDGKQKALQSWVRDENPPASNGGKACDPAVMSGQDEIEIACEYVPAPPKDCILGEKVFGTPEPWGPCNPNGTQTRRMPWTKPRLQEPENGGALCGPESGYDIETQNCHYEPPPLPEPTPGLEHWPLRSAAEIAKYVGTSYTHQYDPHMDACKVSIVVFPPTKWALEHPLSETDTLIVASWATKSGWQPRGLKFHDTGEIMKVETSVATIMPDGSTRWDLRVQRGFKGTTPTPHAVGATFQRNSNSLQHQLRLPIKSQDGHDYLIIHDFLLTASCMKPNFMPRKSFQLESNAIWFETNLSQNGQIPNPARVGHNMTAPGFDPTKHVGVLVHRCYNKLGGPEVWTADDPTKPYLQAGPKLVDTEPAAPMVGHKLLTINRWYREYQLVQQRANDYDLVSTWIADSDSCVQMLDRIPLNVRPQMIEQWWNEWNSSDDNLYEQNDRILYIRDVKKFTDPDPARVAAELAKLPPAISL